eukprot:gene8739-6145_t
MGKPELQLQYLDEWMIRWKKFQTESDWRIEKNRQWWRKFDLFASAGVAGALTLYTAGTATLRRQFGPPHFFDIGLDARIKANILEYMTSSRRYTPQGYGRLLVVGIPTYLTFAVLEHRREKVRLRKYLRQQTVFGEQARRLISTGKIEEYLPVNIQATLPEEDERKLYH